MPEINLAGRVDHVLTISLVTLRQQSCLTAFFMGFAVDCVYLKIDCAHERLAEQRQARQGCFGRR